MKLHLKILLFICLAICVLGCIPAEQKERVVSFWTMQELEVEMTLLVNEEEEGALTTLLEKPLCGNEGLISIPLIDDKDMNISLMSNDGGVINLGLINLFSVSNGIMVKPETDSSFYVFHDIDDVCTTVRLKW